MLLSRHFRRKFLATVLTAGVFMLLYEATVIDSRSMGDTAGSAAVGPPARGVRTAYEATAYCRGTTTASGVAVRAGIAASDPKMLPTGSVIQVDGVKAPYAGIYTVLDTGPEIQGREVDLYMWNCDEAVRFGRQKVTVTVLRSGWAHSAARKAQRQQ
jgi:3D (Asp-Asp-Asp) domain-containing protein